MGRDEIFIFVGPSLGLAKAEQLLEATYLPPVKYGDVYRITTLFRPKIIGIVDGYFNQVPAVWHKEILWAMNQGTLVFGAASMGALRAAELDQFGMLGYGKIYEAYSTGILPPFNDEAFEDDDEVAVVHGPAEMGYSAASDAMVNIRFSLAKAVQKNIIDEDSCQQLGQLAKSLFYADRQYTTVLKQAKHQGVAQQDLAKLKNWLHKNAVDQKQADAITMLKAISEYVTEPIASHKRHSSTFQHTSQWQNAIEEIDQSHAIDSPALDELRLQGPAYFQALNRALQTMLGCSTPQNSVKNTDLNQLHQAPEALDKLLAQLWQAHINQSTTDSFSNALSVHILLNYLNQTGAISDLTQRANDKKLTLAKLEHKPELEQLNEVDKLQLCDWYFTQQLRMEMPSRIEDYAFNLGCRDVDELYAMILGEYLYQEVDSSNGNRT